MRFHTAAAIAATTLLVAPLAWPQSGGASLAGSYKMVSNTNTAADGKTTDSFGANPNGMMILAPDGRFAIVNARSDLPKFASGSRLQGTADENKAIVQGSISLFGTYTVDDAAKALILRVEGTSWPGWQGTEQKRAYTMSGEDLTWTVPSASGGGTAKVVWRRLK